MHDPRNAEQGGLVSEHLQGLAGVRRAEVNAALGCVVVSHDSEWIDVAELIDAVDKVEDAGGLADEPYAEASAIHPANPGNALGHAVVIGANISGLGYAAVTRALPVPALPESIPAMLTTADSSPKVRGTLESHLGRAGTDLLFSLGNAAAHTLAQQPTSLVTDSAFRFCLLRESQAAQRSWVRWDKEFGAHTDAYRNAAQHVEDRPGSLPSGPVERAAHSSLLAGPAAFAAALGATWNLQRAQGFLVAAAPRPAQLGRDAFAAQLGFGLAERGALVLDPRALRTLDRIDTVVIDAASLPTGRRAVQDLVALTDDVDSAELWERAHALIGAEEENAPSPDGWTIHTVRSRSDLPEHWRDSLRLPATPGGQVVALNRNADTVAVLEVVDELDPLTDELVAASRAVGSVRIAGRGSRLAERLDVEDAVPGGTHLAWSVRELQAEGRGVAVVSSHGGTGLAAADLGIGIARGTAPPWGSHVFSGPGMGESCALLRLIPFARTVSLRSAQFATAASVGGALLALLGPASRSQARAGIPVSTASVLALGAGTWWGIQAARRPVPHVAPRTPWHAMSSSKVLERLDSSPAGLSDEQARHRIADRGERPEHQRVGLLHASLEELEGPLTPALAGGAALSAGIGAITDAAVIGAVLGMNALIGGVQRLKADRALGELLQASTIPVALRRNGTQADVAADELVPGDVVDLVSGDSVPADCRLLEAEGIEVDESSLTGESQLVTKTEAATPAAAVADRRSMLYQGTAVAAGQASAVVVAIGSDTEAGRAVGTEDGRTRTGGVAARLRSLAKTTVPLCAGAGVVLLIADLLRGRAMGVAVGRAVSLAVAAVPEGLPFVATAAELASAQRLSQRGALVRNSSTIEALGRAQALCFDKTGTLTEGRISLRYVSDGTHSLPVEEAEEAQRTVVGAALRASPAGESGEALPHPTDRAVVEGAQELGVPPEEGMPGWRRVEELPFEPSRSYHAVLGSSDQGQLLSVKGAPEVVLAQCTHWRADGGRVLLDDAARQSMTEEMDRLARMGFRVLAVAERPASDRRDLDESRIRDLTLSGMIALADTIRPTAAESVAQLQQAGVQIVMVTGDHPSTAQAIAADLGVLNGHRVITGPDLDSLDDGQLSEVVGDVAVFARVTPEQKARIVRALQSIDRIVAVTGDGANDAPAIRLADIGIALGAHATPAAREAADLVVTDDRIETIVDAIVEGRAMWASVRDSLAILLGGNLGEIGYTVITGLVTPQGGMNARQLLLVNVLTDVLPAMAIAVRPPPQVTPQMLLAEGPEASLGSALTRDIYRRGAITAGAATAAWFLGRMTGTARHASTVALVALISAQLGQTLVIRGRTPLVIGCALASVAALVAVVQTPGLSQFFGCTPMWPHGWGIALGATTAATLVSLAFQ
ncbi:cation-translocating P-type ATPase [Haloactinomyces albus]|uniref:Cation-transporting ATPase I n=1 Tax=Haloactinomyces albus TaxID=1352928 RepID=A0AAE4CQH0_9ACTN|nr:cation-translocating P-type ATPase [Haloactinomyces albus]MDR7304122.1 cation-transporting ATPase I [Haloactinomyces albus]